MSWLAEVGASHGHTLHFHGHSPVHRAAPHRKILALVGFMLLVVATPRDLVAWWPAYVLEACALLTVVGLSQVPLSYLLPRLVIEVPFVVFALILPFVALGPRVEVLGVQLSQTGLMAGAVLIVKGSLGVLASLTLAATTTSDEILRGLTRLRMPDLIVQIMSFMMRYAQTVIADLQRMLVAMRSRGCEPRSPRHWPALARALGSLFIRSYERGERVHLAMVSRGYDGRLP